MTRPERMMFIKLASSVVTLSDILNKIVIDLPDSQLRTDNLERIQVFIDTSNEIYELIRKEWLNDE